MALLEARAAMIAQWHPAVDYARQNGIDLRRVAHATGGGPFLVPVRLTPSRRFEVDPDSQTIGVVVEAFDRYGELVDLVCWSQIDPLHVRTAIGAAAMLGEDVAANPATVAFGLPLRLFRSPVKWLQHGCDGAAVVDVAKTVRWLIDIEAPAIAAEDNAHAAELHQARVGLIARQRIVVPDVAPERRVAA